MFLRILMHTACVGLLVTTAFTSLVATLVALRWGGTKAGLRPLAAECMAIAATGVACGIVFGLQVFAFSTPFAFFSALLWWYLSKPQLPQSFRIGRLEPLAIRSDSACEAGGAWESLLERPSVDSWASTS